MMACGGVKPWSFPACVTAPWRLACACPRASLSPRSPATCRHRRRPSGFAGPAGSPATSALRPRPAAADPASTGSRRASKYPDTGPLHTTLRNQPSPKARAHTAADMRGRRSHRHQQLSHTERADLLPSVQIKGLRLPLVLLEHVVGAHTYALSCILSLGLIHGP